VGGGTFGCRVLGHLGFAHARRLRPGIGRLASPTDSFGSACDTNPGRRIRASIGFDRECTRNSDVGCVFDIHFGLAKVTAGSSFIISSGFISGSNTAGVEHIGTGVEIGRSANTARGHSSAHVRGACKSRRDTNRRHARPSARIEYRLRVRISVAGVCVACVWVRLRIWLRVRVRLPICARVRARDRRTGASRQFGSSNRFGHPPRGSGKANIRDASRRQTPLGAVCSIPDRVTRWLRNGHAPRDSRKTSAEVGDTNNTASTARTRRLATASSEGAAAAGKARKLARIGSSSNAGSSSNIGSFGRIWCLDRIWTGPRAGTNISRGTGITNISRTGVGSSDRRRACCSADDHRNRINIRAMGKVRHYVGRKHRLRITARLIGGAIFDCHAVDISHIVPVRSGSRARSNTPRCDV
jgi:hypothetical protein